MGKKHYSQSIKDEAVLFYELGHSFAETQAKYGMAESTFFTWKQKFDKAHPVHAAITTNIIRQAAVGIGHISAALDHDDLCVFIQTADAGRGRCTARHTAYDHNLHLAPSTMAAISDLGR